MRPSTSRTFPADARAMARNPAGWKLRMLAPNAATASGAVPSENIVGSSVPTNSSPDSSDRASACRSRWEPTSAGSDPPHPA